MMRQLLLWSAVVLIGGVVLGLQFKVAGKTTEGQRTNEPMPRYGASLAGAEFGTQREDFCNEVPGVYGRDYIYNHEATIRRFCEQDVRLLRIPVRWERLQPRLGEPLDQAELQRLVRLVGWARKHGGVVILDIHNYGRYVLRHRGHIIEAIIDNPENGTVLVSRKHFADLWSRLSEAFQDEPGVCAYGLMNEPHDMGQGDWKVISQAAVDAIRQRGDTKRILVAGDGWSHADRFAELNGRAAWIRDPANNIAYEAHCYFDHDQSGRYERSFEQELAQDPQLRSRGAARLAPFVAWCRANGVQGFIGEYGTPNDDPRWQEVLKPFNAACDRAELSRCAWAGGEWWNRYRLSVTPEALAHR